MGSCPCCILFLGEGDEGGEGVPGVLKCPGPRGDGSWELGMRAGNESP